MNKYKNDKMKFKNKIKYMKNEIKMKLKSCSLDYPEHINELTVGGLTLLSEQNIAEQNYITLGQRYL